MELNFTVSGVESDLPPVLLVHGLFGSLKNLGGLARRLDGSRKVISVDMRNHGDSPWDDSHTYPELAADLAHVITSQGGVADVVGHSMGGKASMALALTRPDMVRRLIVMDIAPFDYPHDQSGLIQRMQELDTDGLTLRSEADKRLRIQDPGTRAFLLQSLDMRANPARWKMNLDALDDQMDTLTGWPDDLPRASFDGPALFLAGRNSTYVTDESAPSIHTYFPQADLQWIEGAGHWLHAEKPTEVAEAVAAFLG